MSTLQDERGLNQAAYRRLKKELEKTHKGKFVGIARGKVVADAFCLEELLEKIKMIEPINHLMSLFSHKLRMNQFVLTNAVTRSVRSCQWKRKLTVRRSRR